MTTENVLYKLDVSKDLSYKYDASGLRTGKTYNCLQKATLLQDKTASLSDKSTETEFYYVNGNLHYQHSVTTKKDGDTFETDLYFYYDSNGYLTGIEYDDTNYYPATNLKGDVVAIYDRFGSCVAKYEYDAWGNVIAITDASGNAITDETHIANLNPIRYRGYYYDVETKFYYLQSRYYNPNVGRFLNSDSISDSGAGVLGYNTFIYCANNPVNATDPSGHSLSVTLGIMAIGGFIGAVVSGVASALVQKKLTGSINKKSVAVAVVSGFVSGAVAASPLGIIGQQVAGGIIGGVSYVADSCVNKKPIKADEAFVAIGMGVISGRIGGSGANERMVLTNTISYTKNTIARELRRSNLKYSQKVISSALGYQSKILTNATWNSSVRFAAGVGVANGFTGAYAELDLFPEEKPNDTEE